MTLVLVLGWYLWSLRAHVPDRAAALGAPYRSAQGAEVVRTVTTSHLGRPAKQARMPKARGKDELVGACNEKEDTSVLKHLTRYAPQHESDADDHSPQWTEDDAKSVCRLERDRQE